MAEETNISWADATFNPWVGCTRVSPACDGCYAAHMMETRFSRAIWGGPGKGTGTRSRTSPGNWSKPIAWDRAARLEGRRPFVFCSSLADVFDKHVDASWRADLFELIRKTPNLVWLLLSKRPQLMVKLSDAAGGLPPNAALGTTVEDQTRADINLPALEVAKLELRPLFTFGSFEPLLGPVVIPEKMIPDWIITGGETDQGEHKARPTHPDWFRSLRDQAVAAGSAYHHKQNGEWKACPENLGGDWPIESERYCRLYPDGRMGVDGWPMQKVGKTLSGRQLDGVTHDAFPEV